MKPINVVALGVYRHVAASTDAIFEGTPYRVAAILDLTSEPQTFRYSAHNLGVVLHTLQPRPKVFVSGAMITEEMANEAVEVWDNYVKTLGVENTLQINLQGGMPKGTDWKSWIIGKLDEKYKPAAKEL